MLASTRGQPSEILACISASNSSCTTVSFTEREGVSVFFRDNAGHVFHTYSAYAHGIDMLNVDYHYLDLVPKGRDEGDRGPYWVRRHDEYGR